MALVLTDEQRMVKESAEGFFAENAPVSQLRKLRDAADADGFDRGLWAKMAEMGFAGVAIPEQFGGAGLGMVAAAVMVFTWQYTPWSALYEIVPGFTVNVVVSVLVSLVTPRPDIDEEFDRAVELAVAERV